MLISKTMFKNNLRNPSYIALERIYRDGDSALVTFGDPTDIDYLMSEEARLRKQEIFGDMFDDEDESILNTGSDQFKAMEKVFSDIEIIAGNILQKKFPDNKLHFSLNTFQQKKLNIRIGGDELYCFLDGYQEDTNNKTRRIFEVKSTTSSKFMKLVDSNKDSIFKTGKDGITKLYDGLDSTDKKYNNEVRKLKDWTNPVGKYVYDLAYQAYISFLTKPDDWNDEYYLITLNHDYEFSGEYINGIPQYTEDLIKIFDLTELIEDMILQVSFDVAEVSKTMNEVNVDAIPLHEYMRIRGIKDDKFYNLMTKDIPEKNSILTFLYNHTGFAADEPEPGKPERLMVPDLIKEGVYDMLDIDVNYLNRETNVIQYNAVKNNEAYLNKNRIKETLELIEYPLYHLDFETFPNPLPRFKGEKPYTQSPFQFSVHQELEKGVCDMDTSNISYIISDPNVDMREEFVKQLLESLGTKGSILVYNKGFESRIIRELSESFKGTEYEQPLKDLQPRLFDLMIVFRGSKNFYKEHKFDDIEGVNYYHPDQNGSFSIKALLPIFTNLNYDDLEISNGQETVLQYSKLDQLNEENKEKVIKHMIDYCKLDTWAMVELLWGLYELVE